MGPRAWDPEGVYGFEFLLRFFQFFIYLIKISFHTSDLLSLESSISALGCFGYLIFQRIHLGFQIINLFSKFLNFLFILESLFLLHLSCLFVKGASSNLGCLAPQSEVPPGLSPHSAVCGSQV